MPLLSRFGQSSNGMPKIPITLTSNIHQSRHSGIYIPVQLALFSPIPSQKKNCCLWVKPSQVDLFSRIAFPLFFVLFHVTYWTVYLNIN